MKKILICAALFTAGYSAAFAQDEKYTMAMEPKVMMADTSHSTNDLIALSAAFERIAETEKTKWLPYYYAALTQTNAAYMITMQKPDATKTDPMADKAETLINKAEALSANNSEIYIVKKMIASLRLMADPMSRFRQYGPIAEEALQTAMKLNPENPRVYLLQAEDKYFTPEQYGGSKIEAKILFETATKKYESFKPASSLDPNWGRGTTQYFLGQLNK